MGAWTTNINIASLSYHGDETYGYDLIIKRKLCTKPYKSKECPKLFISEKRKATNKKWTLSNGS